MRVSQFTTFAALGTLAAASSAMAGTVATFADPAVNGSTPLFSFDGAWLTGSWSGTGLTLLTPDLPSIDYPNATFQMTPLSVVSSFGPLYLMSGGTITYKDQFANDILVITFGSAYLSSSLGLGSSDFQGNNVTFSGSLLAGYTATNEASSFSFANPLPAPGGFTVTSSFTSSANLVVPAPGAAALIGMGGLLAARRRR